MSQMQDSLHRDEALSSREEGGSFHISADYRHQYHLELIAAQKIDKDKAALPTQSNLPRSFITSAPLYQASLAKVFPFSVTRIIPSQPLISHRPLESVFRNESIRLLQSLRFPVSKSHPSALTVRSF